MTSIPEELTPELLGLVLDKNITEITKSDRWIKEHGYGIHNSNYIYPVVDDDYIYEKIHIDTLTRLMKEWVAKQYTTDGYMFTKFIRQAKYTQHQFYMNFKIVEKEFLSDTEFKAVLKATSWVAKEKGLV